MGEQIAVECSTGDGSEWDAFVDSQPAATNYHLWGWKNVVEKGFKHRCYYLTARDTTGALVGVLPVVYMQSHLFGRFAVSMPFFNYGGVLCSDSAAISPLLDGAKKILSESGASSVELRHLGWKLDNLPAKTHKVTMVLKLAGDVDSQWKAFNPKLRNQIRKAEKSGLRVRIGGQELLDGFYEVFCRNMRDLGTPVYGKVFFEKVLAEFSAATRIISVFHHSRVIASGIVVWYRGTLEMPWASSIRDYKAMCPNNMLYWQAISLAIEQGFTAFDFGRSTPHEGTYNFKKQWGAEPVQLYWQYLLREGQEMPELNPKNSQFEFAIRVWQKMPVWLTNIIGPHIVRNIP